MFRHLGRAIASFSKALSRPRYPPLLQVACQEQHPVKHPSFDYLGPDIMVFRGPPDPESQAHAKNAVVMSNGKLSWEKPVSCFKVTNSGCLLF